MSKLIVAVRCERMDGEGRISLFPDTISWLRHECETHGVILGFVAEAGLGGKVGLIDSDWRRAGARVTSDLADLYGSADIVLGVKQPTWEEVGYLRRGQGISCFLHAAANKEIVLALFEKGVKILPLECNTPSLGAMSREAGLRIPQILDRCYPGDTEERKRVWRSKNIFLLGARGTVGRHAIDALLRAGVGHAQLRLCDLEAGIFSADDTELPRVYKTFSVADDDEMMLHLRVSHVVVLAAFGRDGAPRVISRRHLAILPHKALIVQVTIDEGGNIIEEEFCRPTGWSDPVYAVHLGSKVLYACNLPNIPGCIDSRTSSIALDRVDRGYYLDLCRLWPDVPEEYLFRGF